MVLVDGNVLLVPTPCATKFCFKALAMATAAAHTKQLPPLLLTISETCLIRVRVSRVQRIKDSDDQGFERTGIHWKKCSFRV
jgi:hypothetical protein